jgi:hypothetical protein
VLATIPARMCIACCSLSFIVHIPLPSSLSLSLLLVDRYTFAAFGVSIDPLIETIELLRQSPSPRLFYYQEFVAKVSLVVVVVETFVLLFADLSG